MCNPAAGEGQRVPVLYSFGMTNLYPVWITVYLLAELVDDTDNRTGPFARDYAQHTVVNG